MLRAKNIELLQLVKLHKEKYNKYVTDKMTIAENRNITVLRLPPL